jgi:methylglutaconyl-CoA hydratase
MDVLTETKSAVLTVTLNRPQTKNAMTAEMMTSLRQIFSNIGNEIRAVVLKGAGDFFCAGGDLQWMKSSVDKSPDDNEKDALNLAKMIRAIDECPVPVITQVKGGAFGGGVGLVAASDIVMADDDALFSLSEVKLGLIPATIGPIVLRKIGWSAARKYYLTGKRFKSAEAKAIQLIHDVAPASTFFSLTNEYLHELSSSGPQAVREAKKLLRQMSGNELWREDIAEVTSKILSRIRVGEEAQEGISAFLNRKTPSWKRSLTES